MARRSRRTSITVRPQAESLLATARIRGANTSVRIERLAQRYTWLVEDLVQRHRASFSSAEWRVFLGRIARLDPQATPREDDLAASVAALARQQGRQPGGSAAFGCDLETLRARLGVLRVAEQLALQDLAERMLDALGESPEDAAIQEFLNNNTL